MCSQSVKLFVSRLRLGVCVCVRSLSVKLLVSRLCQGVCVCVYSLCQLSFLLADFVMNVYYVCVCLCAAS